MNKEESPPGFAARCDEQGILQEILFDNLKLTSLEPGRSMVQCVPLSNRVKMLTFLEELRATGAAFGWEIAFANDKQDEIVTLSGLSQPSGMLLLGGRISNHENSLFYELILINNEQTTTLRKVLKEQALLAAPQNPETELIEDMTRMNNQLVNMQRDLAKKNRELERLYAEVQALSITDALTSQNNRRGLFLKGEQEVHHAVRYRRALSVIMLDIDHFKQINDTYGHASGDQVLRGLADWCTWQLRQVDIFGRYGGEEFAVILPDTAIRNAMYVAERIRKISDHPIRTEQGEIGITVSLGIAALRDGIDDLETLLQAADRAMYQAKAQGRNRICAESPEA